MSAYKKRKIVFYSLINGVGSSTIAYQIARLLRIPFYQEQKNDLAFFLKNVFRKQKHSNYSVKQIDELDTEDYNFDGVYDLKNTNKKIFTLATDIVILTNNSYLDVLKTIASLQKIQELLHYEIKPIHIVFNRLQNGPATREKRYTEHSQKMILANIKDMDIKFSYIRTNLIFYREISEGRFFMDSFFKRNMELLEKYKEIKDMEYIDHLEMFYDYQYEDTPYDFEFFEDSYKRLYDDRVISAIEYNKKLVFTTKKRETTPESINDEIANLNFHQENIRLSRASIRDIYSFMYKLGVYDKNLYECCVCKKDRVCWKRIQREERKNNKLLHNNSKCKNIRERIQE